MKNTILLLLLFINSLSQAQETIPITLGKVLELSGANSLTIQEYQERQALADANLAKAKEWWIPEIYAGVQTHALSGSAMNGNGGFFLEIDQKNAWLGVGLNANWDFAEGIYNKQAAKLESQASVYATQAERNQSLLESIDAYYNLMTAQQNLVAYQNLVTQSDTMVQQLQIQVDAGLRYTSEYLLAKSNQNHLKIALLNAEKEYNLASTVLLRLLNLSQQVKLVSTDANLLPLDYALELITPSVDAFQNRPEIKGNAFEIEALQVAKKRYTTGLLLPEFSIGANSAYFGRINGEVTPIDAVTFPNPNQLYPTNTINAALLWKIPLGALVHKGDVKKYDSLIRLKEVEGAKFKANINAEIAAATIQLQTGKAQIEMAKEALELTSEALNQSIARQQLGTTKPFEVFQAQQFYLQAQMDYSTAVGDYNRAQFALKVARGENL